MSCVWTCAALSCGFNSSIPSCSFSIPSAEIGVHTWSRRDLFSGKFPSLRYAPSVSQVFSYKSCPDLQLKADQKRLWVSKSTGGV